MAIEILVVDDSPVMRAMIIKALRMTDLPLGPIHQAANGAEGLDRLAEHCSDLVLVDINMPVMGGEEMIERMKADPKLAQLPLVVVSTESSETRIAAIGQRGISFIHKPFSPEQIRDVVVEAMGDGDE